MNKRFEHQRIDEQGTLASKERQSKDIFFYVSENRTKRLCSPIFYKKSNI